MTRSDQVSAALCVVWLLAWHAATGGFSWLVRLLSHSDAPAWVQAVGSILAILSGFWVAYLGAKHNRQTALEMRNREASAKLEIAIHIANEARTLVQLAQQSLKGEKDISLGPTDFASVRDAIDALPFAELTHGRVVAELMALRRLLGPVEKLCETHNLVGLAAGVVTKTAIEDEIDRRALIFGHTYEKLERAIRDAIDRLNRSHYDPPPRG